MSTRSTAHFVDKLGYPPTAIVYRHSDGYPTGAGKDILSFIEDVRQNASDQRFDDPSYLAAKYVVWLADTFAVKYDPNTGDWTPAHPLDFISVGILDTDPGDIEYRYTIVCNGVPDVYGDDLHTGPIPLADAIKEYTK